MVKKYKWFVVVFPLWLMLVSCDADINWRFWEKDEPKNVIAVVGEQNLYLEDIKKSLNFEGLDDGDSLLMVDNFIKDWIVSRLLYDKATAELGNLHYVDSLVENYRRSLVAYEYELQLVNEHLGDKLSEEKMKEFYKENPQVFGLTESLMKGMLLVAYSNAPDLHVLESLMLNPSEDNIDLIASLSVKNAAKFDYFVDSWVPISEVKKNSPLMITEKKLQNGKLCTLADSVHTVFLFVNEYKEAGDLQPYEYAKNRIRSILMEQNKNEFLLNFRRNLYESGIKKGDAKRFN